jgi:heparin/heparan-sulfate lyase
MNFNYILIYALIILFLGCQDSPVEPYFPPITDENGDNEEEEEETIDPNENIYQNFDWIRKIKLNHPRLYFNDNTLPEVKSRALNEEKALYETIKIRIDRLTGQTIELENPLAENSSDHQLANRAAEAAFLYLITDETKYLELSKNLLMKVSEFYQIRNRNQLIVNWYAHSRVHALMAYDWLFNDLSEEERSEIGTLLFEELEYMLPSANRPNFPGENRSSAYSTGFYGNQVLKWYMGVAFHKTGISPRIDSRAEELLKKGYTDLTGVLDHRGGIAGDDGGANTGTLGYALVDNPWAEYNFFQTFIAATGGYNITTQYDHLANWPNYVFWNILPKMRQFGFGDDPHTTYTIDYPIVNMHLSQLVHFYGDRFPEQASLAKWLMENKFPRVINEPNSFSMSRFFITNKYESISPVDFSDRMPLARHFEKNGQFFMRSGSGDTDTYATFTVGSDLTNHQQYDNNNFMIYKRGLLTIDSGTRPQPGNHLSHYYGKTVAHNCITIRMPGEVMPKYWGTKAPHEANVPAPNDGGQNRVIASNVVAFDEMEHYAYIASDATGSYNSAKTNQVLRQFVFLPPDNFVVFDRVNATNATYPKKWLLHTAYKPEQVSGTEFYANHEEGRLLCKTIFPENAITELIGGPGKQFWADGKNWPLPYGGDNHPLYGQWRVEVSPGTENNNDVFLHLIQAGDRDKDIKTISTATKLEEQGMKGVQFTYEDKEYKVLFSTSGIASGKISITQNGNVIVNENFSNTVKLQSGLALR